MELRRTLAVAVASSLALGACASPSPGPRAGTALRLVDLAPHGIPYRVRLPARMAFEVRHAVGARGEGRRLLELSASDTIAMQCHYRPPRNDDCGDLASVALPSEPGGVHRVAGGYVVRWALEVRPELRYVTCCRPGLRCQGTESLSRIGSLVALCLSFEPSGAAARGAQRPRASAPPRSAAGRP